MDTVYRFNKDRWEALAKADALFSRPWLSETPEPALERVDPSERFGNLGGKDDHLRVGVTQGTSHDALSITVRTYLATLRIDQSQISVKTFITYYQLLTGIS